LGRMSCLPKLKGTCPLNFVKVFMANIREWREQSLKKIGEFNDEHRSTIASGSNANLKDRAKLIQSEIKHLAKDIFDRINTAMEEAKSFYSKIGGAFGHVYYPDWELADIVVGIGFLLERFGETLKNIFTGGGVVKEQLYKRLDEAVESLKAEVEKRFKQAEEFGEKIRRQQA